MFNVGVWSETICGAFWVFSGDLCNSQLCPVPNNLSELKQDCLPKIFNN